MKRLFLLHTASVLLAYSAIAQIPDLSKETPIIIYKDAAEADSVLIDNKQYDHISLGKWLAETSAKFGREHPIVIIVERDTSIGSAADIFQLAKQSHDRVYAIIKGYSLSLPLLLFSTDDKTDISKFVWVMPRNSKSNIYGPSFHHSNDATILYTEPTKELIEQLAKPRAK